DDFPSKPDDFSSMADDFPTKTDDFASMADDFPTKTDCSCRRMRKKFFVFSGKNVRANVTLPVIELIAIL
ncbi:MAG: hypothetical protein JJE25_05650, partial [Bacteroidia bacterium]|nr:hypothetical protein [Bacteroidia bacterium]